MVERRTVDTPSKNKDIDMTSSIWGVWGDVLRSKVCPWKKIDVAVNIVMGGRCDAGEASVREALASYIGELTSLCDPSLICEKLGRAPSCVGGIQDELAAHPSPSPRC